AAQHGNGMLADAMGILGGKLQQIGGSSLGTQGSIAVQSVPRIGDVLLRLSIPPRLIVFCLGYQSFKTKTRNRLELKTAAIPDIGRRIFSKTFIQQLYRIDIIVDAALDPLAGGILYPIRGITDNGHAISVSIKAGAIARGVILSIAAD